MKKLFSLILLSYLAIHTFAQDKISKGSKVNILEIDKEDTYYAERIDFLGKEATALGDLTKNSNGFYSGTLELNSGRTCFFRFVKVATISSPKTSVDTKSYLTGTIPSGTSFKILEVSTDDSYYKDRSNIEGSTGVTTSDLEAGSDGFISGNLTTSNGKSYYFYKVRIGKSGISSSTKSTATTSTSTTTKPITFVTGTIKKGTVLYLAEISPEDSYYSDRFDKIGKKGKVSKEDMTMKSDGYYAGDFVYDDGTTTYFYKAKFSKEPVDKLVKSGTDNVKSSGSFLDDVLTDGDIWEDARNDDDIKEGDKVEITAVSSEDSYYEDKDDYLGKQGIAGNDLEYDSESGGYGGSVKLDDGNSPYFYLVKLKKISSTIKSTTTKSSSSSLPSTIAKNTKVRVVDLGTEDSFYSSKEKYLRKSGKVADGLNLQTGDYYSGKVIFDDGTDAYFFNVKIAIIK